MEPERMVPVAGAELCVQAFGDPGDPVVLLVAGMSSAMDWWECGFCERLAAGRRHIVRYDLRDTGRSTTWPPGRPGYTAADLRADVVGLLDALGARSAHLVGISMGAAIAQGVAVEHPERVDSLTLLATTAALAGAADGLPGMAPELVAYLGEAAGRPDLGRSARDEAIDRLVEDQRAFMRAGFDESRVRAIAERVVDRSADLAAAANHALLEPGPQPAGTLADVTAPTLVVHGSKDPMFPLAHGEALAAAIPGASLLVLEGLGHEAPPPADWDRVVTAMLGPPSGSG